MNTILLIVANSGIMGIGAILMLLWNTADAIPQNIINLKSIIPQYPSALFLSKIVLPASADLADALFVLLGLRGRRWFLTGLWRFRLHVDFLISSSFFNAKPRIVSECWARRPQGRSPVMLKARMDVQVCTPCKPLYNSGQPTYETPNRWSQGVNLKGCA